MSAVSMAVLAGGVVCEPVSIPFLPGIVTAMIDGLGDCWCGFETSDTALVAVGTVDGGGVAGVEACGWSDIFDWVNLVSGITVVDMAGETGDTAAVVLPCIVTVDTKGIVESGNGEYGSVHSAALMAGAVGAAWGCGIITAVIGESSVC